MKLNREEALRYLGAGTGAPDILRQQVEETAQRLEAAMEPRYTYRIYNLTRQADSYSLPQIGLNLSGETAEKMLAQCSRAALLVCTLGAEFERLMRAEQAREMDRAVIMDACGSAYVEAGCDAAEEEIRAAVAPLYLTDRFSPGYGDLPLTLQPEICGALDAGRRLGIHVTESYLLMPGKSITAVIGLSDRPQMARIRGCAYCALRENCKLRKGGNRCEL